MTIYESFIVDKSSGTFADVLTTYGLARLLYLLLEKQEGAYTDFDVRLRDEGGAYRLVCKPALDDEAAVLSESLLPGRAQIVRTKKNVSKLPADLEAHGIDYDDVRDHRNEYFERRSNLSKDALAAERAGKLHSEIEALPSSPHPDWDIFRAVNPMALAGYNTLLLNWWKVQEALPDFLQILFDLYSSSPNNLSAASAAWKKLDKALGWGIKTDATALQLYNPDQGKGQNRAKANLLSMGNVKSFWIPEVLKVIGLYEAAQTRMVRGAKDRKTYALTPLELNLSDHVKIIGEFYSLMRAAETSAKSDILAALRYTAAMLKYIKDEPNSGAGLLLRAHRQPKKLVAGFHIAFYKDLGNAAATMNLSFINLPGWVYVKNTEDIHDYIGEYGILDEHIRLVGQFDESHSDDFTLLQHYRDFVSGDDLDAFFRFTNAYAAYVIGRRERGHYVIYLTPTNLRRLIMGTKRELAPILDSEGFQNIAYAIRQSTVIAQYRKKQGDRRYDVRYGLGQELTRKANYPDEFIAELSDFLHKYNAENAQVLETRQGPYRRSIRTADIDEIVQLIDAYDSKTICNLLVAYGYARERRENETSDENEEETTNA